METKKDIQNKGNFLVKKYHFRKNIINYIYQFELFDINLNTEEIVNNKLNVINENELKTLELIECKYETLKNIAKKFLLNSWEWSRISPLSRAIIIFGIYELTYNEPKVVINEMINISKLLSPNEDYKFINGILDRVAKQIAKK
ncbi:N utilization substance protein B, NusB-like protein [Metamycoplasma auris 15026]|uniref:N utilization substance protein B, NusB-like protein n=1 Tax=Metamycoplasma auris 15026 TaxID=1188233 RepID=N9VD26_9BACT|nr:transcription antitermination protein NusB [Metamycoplasma auris]ENY69311.1 N utilization substance protein B, NusB-like protein [Metamycoplasma auris 15026]